MKRLGEVIPYNVSPTSTCTNKGAIHWYFGAK